MLRADVSADPDYRARFNREADLASKLWHPHIVSVHDRGEYNGQLWISMDYVDGLVAGRLLASQRQDMGTDRDRSDNGKQKTGARLSRPRRQASEFGRAHAAGWRLAVCGDWDGATTPTARHWTA